MLRATIVVIVLSALIAPPAAEAATRYAAPGGAGVAGPCSQDSPCSLRAAIGLAGDGDRVVVAPGEYTFEHPLDVSDRRLEIVAASQAARPVLTSTVGGGSVALTIGPGSLLRDVDIVQAGGAGFALHAAGTIERVRITLTAAFARGMRLGRDVTIRDTVVFGRGAEQHDGIVAYAATAGGAIDARLRNVTVVLDGDGGVALEARAADDQPVLIDARAVLLRGTQEDAVIYGAQRAPVTLRAADANLRDAGSVVRGLPSAFVDGGGVTDAEPAFRDRAAGDLRPAPDSPTVDAGSTDEHSGTRDVMGLPRGQGAGPDVGAHESVVPPPVRVVGTPRAAADAITATGEITPGPWRLTARWRVELLGPAGLVAAGPWTLALFAERQTRTFDGLAPGRAHRVRVVATGGFGESASVEAEVSTAAVAGGDGPPPDRGDVTPPPPAGDAAPGLAPSPTEDAAPPTTSPRDRTAPRLRLAWRGRGLRITTSEAARVTLSLRGRGGRTLRTRTLRLRRGTTTVRAPRVSRGVCSVRLVAADAAGNRTARTFTRRCR